MKALRRAFVAFVVAAVFLPACLKERDIPPVPTRVLTEAGYKFVTVDRGVISSGLMTWGELAGAFDQAVLDAAEYLNRYGTPVDEVLELARSCTFGVVDDAWYQTPASPTGYAAGVAYPDFKYIVACLWRFNHTAASPPASSPSWTWHGSPWYSGWNVWGSLPLFLVLAHELGHLIWGGRFEHDWTPPVVNPPSARLALRQSNWLGECAVVHARPDGREALWPW